MDMIQTDAVPNIQTHPCNYHSTKMVLYRFQFRLVCLFFWNSPWSDWLFQKQTFRILGGARFYNPDGYPVAESTASNTT